MTFTFKPAEPTARPMSIGLAGPGGSGKTYTALILAKALAAGGKVAFIDTESGRGQEYVQDFDYIYTRFDPPFTPERYIEAIEAAIAAGAKAIVVDSATHEWEGEGGILESVNDMVVERGEKIRMVAWARFKPLHRKMVYYAARGSVHTIFCFRAREKVKITEDKKVIPMGWQPCTNEEANYEFRLFAMFDPDKQGVPMHVKTIKYLEHLFKKGQQITPQVAEKIAKWANGTSQKPAQAPPATAAPSGRTDTENGSPRSEGAAVAEQLGIRHDPPEFVEDDPDELQLTDEEAVARAKHICEQAKRTETMDKINDLSSMAVDLKGRVPADNYTFMVGLIQKRADQIHAARNAA